MAMDLLRNRVLHLSRIMVPVMILCSILPGTLSLAWVLIFMMNAGVCRPPVTVLIVRLTVLGTPLLYRI